jgi:cytochrome oxidase Cu insertion factor (SCO1/SenC/PrrC family)
MKLHSAPWPTLILVAVLFLAFGELRAQQTRTKVDLSKLGAQVGEQVPDFSLTDQNGKTWTRQSIMGRNGAMLVFFRSADW